MILTMYHFERSSGPGWMVVVPCLFDFRFSSLVLHHKFHDSFLPWLFLQCSSIADHLSLIRFEISAVVSELIQFEVLRAEACFSESTTGYHLTFYEIEQFNMVICLINYQSIQWKNTQKNQFEFFKFCIDFVSSITYIYIVDIASFLAHCQMGSSDISNWRY